MNAYDVERELNAWLDAIEPGSNFDQLLDRTFAVTRREGQRPALLAQLATRTWLGPTPALAEGGLRFALTMILLLLALLGVALAAGALEIPPPPRIDGAIAIERSAFAPGGWPEDAGRPPYTVTLVLPDGTLTPITPGDRDEACSSFSPDGSRLALLSAPRREPDDRKLAVTDPRAGAERLFLAPGWRAPQQEISAPSWAPDGSAVAAVLHGPHHLIPIDGDLLVVPVDGSPPTTLVRVGRVAEGQRRPPGLSMLQGPSWSPDGRWIAFRAQLDSEHGWSYVVAVVRPDGTDLRMLDTWPPIGSREWGGVAWSADSQWLAYHRRPPGASGGGMDAYAVNVGSGVVRRLTASAGNEFVAEWSPDGTRIVTVGIDASPAQIIDFATGAAVALDLPPGAGGATWSVNGNLLAVLQEERLWMAPSDGSTAPRLVADGAVSLCGGIGSGISWQEVAP